MHINHLRNAIKLSVQWLCNTAQSASKQARRWHSFIHIFSQGKYAAAAATIAIRQWRSFGKIWRGTDSQQQHRVVSGKPKPPKPTAKQTYRLADTLSDTAFGRQRKFSATLTYPSRISENKTHTPQSKQKQKQPKENVNKTRKENKMWYKWGKKTFTQVYKFCTTTTIKKDDVVGSQIKTNKRNRKSRNITTIY